MLSSLAVLGALAAGCGSGSSTAATGPSTEFMAKGGNNKPATFGEPADQEEFEAAARVLEESLGARAAGEWAKQCATLTPSAIEKIEADAPNFGAKKGCANGLRAEAKPFATTKDSRANSLTGPITVLRVKGKRGYLLYHGAKHRDYAMPVAKEGGEWKIGRVTTINVP